MDLKTIKMIRTLTDTQLIDVALKLLARDPALFTELDKGGGVHVRIREASLIITEEQLRQLNDVDQEAGWQGSKKVTTIKAARNMFSIALKEAKDLIEELAVGGYVNRDYARDPTYGTSSSCVVVVG